jgi:hypothetical protein
MLWHILKHPPRQREPGNSCFPHVQNVVVTGKHKATCEYLTEGIPRGLLPEVDPLCSCGRGKVPRSFLEGEFGGLAPYVTRIAVSLLFGVSYVETIASDMKKSVQNVGRGLLCDECREPGKPQLKVCCNCKEKRYCSEFCQRKRLGRLTKLTATSQSLRRDVSRFDTVAILLMICILSLLAMRMIQICPTTIC